MYTGNQTTILNEISFFGKPKNMEKVVNVKLLAGEIDDGIIFKRVDLKENNIIKLNYENSSIVDNKLILKNDKNVYIKSSELFIASIWAGKIDNLIVEIDGESLPYIDGTSEPLNFLFTAGKTKNLEKSRKIFEITENLKEKINDFEISVKSDKTFKISIKNFNNEFEFDNSILPFKDWLSRITENDDNQAKYNILETLVIIYISGSYCLLNIEIKNFDKNNIFEFFKKFFLTKNS